MTDLSSPLAQALRQRILILDGAMGTMIQGYGFEEADFRSERFKDHHMPLKGNNDLLSITQPEIIEKIHAQYLEAGADIIETNSFNGNAVSMADYGLEDLVYELNHAAAQVARRAADRFSTEQKPRFVAGVLGRRIRRLRFHRVEAPEYRNITDELVADYSNAAQGRMVRRCTRGDCIRHPQLQGRALCD